MSCLNCDLHVHSNNSDGSYPPSYLIEEAKKQGLVIALTDHNTTKGLDAFLEEAKKQGLTVVAGVELSTVYNGKEIHLLGLFVDKEYYEKIENLFGNYHVLKEQSNIMLIKRLNESGYNIDYETVKRRNVNGNVNRAHIATELCEKGYVESTAQAFETLLSEKNGLYVPPERLDFFFAVKFLREIKAVPVIAHPLVDLDENALREMLPKAIESGLMGMETIHSKYTTEKLLIADKIAEEFNLLKSGGSDYHGAAKPDVKLGVGKGNISVPVEFYYKLKDAKDSLI